MCLCARKWVNVRVRVRARERKKERKKGVKKDIAKGGSTSERMRARPQGEGEWGMKV